MSNLIRTYYESAQLSDAAYADLAAGMARREYEDALIARGFASLEATEFANRYSIVSTLNDIATGFSATLFQRNGTNEKILAIRGTNDVVDFLTSNLQIGLLGMASQYTSLNTFYLQLIVKVSFSRRTRSLSLGTRWEGISYKPSRLTTRFQCPMPIPTMRPASAGF